MLEVGQRETVKAATHGALGVLAATCAIYNALAATKRQEPHLVVNAIVYAALTLWEAKKTREHWQDR